MKKITFILVLALTACHHKSSLKQEGGVVIEKQWTPEFDASGTGTGMSSRGSLVVTSTHLHEDAKFLLVFKCDHRRVFTVNNRQLYAELEKGDSVNIMYQEWINDRDSSVDDFIFIDAVKCGYYRP